MILKIKTNLRQQVVENIYDMDIDLERKNYDFYTEKKL